MRRTQLQTAVAGWRRRLGVPAAGDTVIVGLSGGADSVALLDALSWVASRDGRFGVVAAHLDHGLRASSPADARFCGELCGRLGLRLVSAAADVERRARRDRLGVEAAARAERYAFLESARRQEKATFVATAHTLDDQAETFLLRLLRGAGGTGLSAMRPRVGHLLRPLLGVTRGQVIEHLRERRLAWREDASNRDAAFLRNRVRHELIPFIEARFNPNLKRVLARTADLMAEDTAILAVTARELFHALASPREHGLALDRAALNAAPPALARLAVREALLATGGLTGVGAFHVDRLVEVARRPASGVRRLALPGQREALIGARYVLLGRRGSPSAPAAGQRVPGAVLEAAAAAGPA